MMQNMCFIAFNVRGEKISDIPRLSVGFGSMSWRLEKFTVWMGWVDGGGGGGRGGTTF